ncbi:DUF294 nucleotidyltransferase-like domain-containing protein [Heliorestis convoluta]|uniref:Cyclic nucleotide-binding/CBS domain-containing protein n=1 Tax=Heliorestis convoluta TaxID=356322 RepID=A0A5Q2N056_9FIRM|nr:DUF294 nucleotidyltransferase-like domain-containing protein [Heliorestis convoluta]QGG48664.1 cyclic nucleotide-binding/CBS domain-containing protein [Heliorestis convoluta]
MKIDDQLLRQINRHPLFKGVSLSELERLLRSCELKQYSRSEKIFYSKSASDGLLLLLSGLVEIYIDCPELDDKEKDTLEVLQPNQLVGLSAVADFLSEPVHYTTPQNLAVRALDDCQCLSIPFSVLEERWNDDGVRDYILRQLAARLKDVYSSLAEQVKQAREWGERETFVRRVDDLMSYPVLSVESGVAIYEAAQKMIDHRASSVVVMKEGQLIGIITEKDMVASILEPLNAREGTVDRIMTATPFTISRQAYYYEAISLFLTKGIKHLPVVDGDQVVGMVTLSDLLRKKHKGTVKMVQAIEEASHEKLPEVKEGISYILSSLLRDGTPILHTLDTVTSLYDRLVRHCVDLALQSMEEDGHGLAPVSFCWLQMGSAGRREQFMLTDQDHFLIFDDPLPEKREEVEYYFALLGQKIVRHLEWAGYALCRGKMMASEKQWRGSLTQWEERLRGWMIHATNEKLMLAQNFFSFRFVYGDPLLYGRFLEKIYNQLDRSGIFLFRLAQVEKEQPVPQLGDRIRSLFRLERKSIDIKKEALFPFHHALQILALHHGVVDGTPREKIQHLVNKDAMTSAFAEDLLNAFSTVMRIRVEYAWKKYERQEEVSSVVPFSYLRSNEKDELVRALKVLRSLQNHMFAEFGLL